MLYASTISSCLKKMFRFSNMWFNIFYRATTFYQLVTNMLITLIIKTAALQARQACPFNIRNNRSFSRPAPDRERFSPLNHRCGRAGRLAASLQISSGCGNLLFYFNSWQLGLPGESGRGCGRPRPMGPGARDFFPRS